MIHRSVVTFLLLSSTVASADYLRVGKSNIDGKEGEYRLEKGIRCKGGVVKDEKSGKMCLGRQKFAGEVKTTATELLESVAYGLHEHLHEGYLPTKNDFKPSQDEMQQIMEMEDEMSSIEEGEEKAVEFGGFVKLFWGCNATISRESKETACGIKAFQGAGKKAYDSVIDVDGNDYLRIPDNSFYDDIFDLDKKKGGVYRLEKGIRCSGGGVKGEKSGKKCEGGQKFGSCAMTKPHDLVESVADGLHEHMQEGYLPRMEGFMPTEGEMEQIMEIELEISSTEKGRKKVVEFGGFTKMFWGCKVTFKKKRGKVLKGVGCGLKSFQGAGVKEDDTIELAYEYM